MRGDFEKVGRFAGLSGFLNRFLKRLFGRYRELFGKVRVNRDAGFHYEVVARFIFWANHFSKVNSRPKPSAFLPSNGECSATWIDGLSEQQIWVLGDLAGRGRKRPALARADIQAKDVADCGLVIAPDPLPSQPLHVNLTSWPIEKDEQKEVAQNLCAKSVLVIRASFSS